MLTVSRDDKAADLDGWVTLANGSGTSFRNTKLQLVAGDLNRVYNVLSKAARRCATRAGRGQRSDGAGVLLRLSPLHAGTKDDDQQQRDQAGEHAHGTGVPIRKRYVVEGQSFYYHNGQHPGSPIKDVVQVFYQFKNEERGGLGMPMPAGVVRVYQADSKGGTQFVGEDRINHTPKDEELNLKIGNAFDVICERKQIDFQKIASNVYELEYEITLRNHKATAITVDVNEPIGGTWTMVRSSHAWNKTAAWAAKFAVPVAPTAPRC